MLEPMETITTEQIQDAMENGYEVTVIINGEYYKLKEDNVMKENSYLWKVSDFHNVNKKWGNFRRIIGELPIGSTDGIIYLMEENDDHRKSIAVHDKRNGNMIVKLGFYWVDSAESQQKALNTIFDKLMMG